LFALALDDLSASFGVQGTMKMFSAGLPARHLLESPQRPDQIVEFRDSVHRVEHNHVGADPALTGRSLSPVLRVRIAHARPALDAEFRRVSPK
jgi:hypothetical protein